MPRPAAGRRVIMQALDSNASGSTTLLADARLRAQLAEVQSQLAAAEAEKRRLQQDLNELREAHRGATAELNAQAGEYLSWPDAMNMMATFEAIDENHDGELTKEEFRNGYALIREREIETIFDTFDDNHDGVLTRDEFAKGYSLLVESDAAQAAAQRQKVARAVAEERVRATKAAARNLAEAQLMDALFDGPTAGVRRVAIDGSPPRRQPNSRQPFTMQGMPPKGFDVQQARALVAARVEAKANHDYAKAEELQAELGRMRVRLDDRYRTWTVQTHKSEAGRGRGRGGGAKEKVVATAKGGQKGRGGAASARGAGAKGGARPRADDSVNDIWSSVSVEY